MLTRTRSFFKQLYLNAGCDLDDKAAEHLLSSDPNAKLNEYFPTNSTPPIEEDRKRKFTVEKDNVATPKKRKKKYVPKVIGQTKRKTTPKVSNESKIEGGHVSKRTPKSKSKSKSGETSSLSNRKSSKRCLIFEQEEDIKEPLYMVNGLDDLTVEGDGFQMPVENIAEIVKLRGPLLNDICEKEINIPTRRRSKCLKKSIFQKRKVPFQHIVTRKRSNNRRRKINFDSLIIPTSLSLQSVKDEKKEGQGLISERQWKTKGKRMKKTKKREERTNKVEPTNLKIVTVPKHESGTSETSEGSKSPSSMGNLVENPLAEDDKGEDGVKMIKSEEMVSDGEVKDVMEVIIEKFQSMNIGTEAPYKNQDRRLASFKGTKKGRRNKVNGNNTELVAYENQDRGLVPYKGKKERVKVKVNLDSETLKEWDVIMHGMPRDENEENNEYWKQERLTYLGRVIAFIARMHNFLGKHYTFFFQY